MHPLSLLAAARRLAPPRPTPSGLGFLEQLSPKQKLAHYSKAKQLALQCGRRAGKTDLIAKRLLEAACRFPGANEWTGYICLTKGAARRNMAGPLEELISAYDLPITGPHEVDGQLTYVHENGHRIWLGGVDDMRKAERWRGNKWRAIFIDEAGAWPDDVLRVFVRVIIRPALSDSDGTLWVCGSPGPIEKGFFFDITTGKNPKVPKWETHHWTVLDNPFHRYGQPGGRALLEAEEMVANGLTADDPTWIREWLGQWCSDPDALIYPFDSIRNEIAALPAVDSPLDWRWTLGVDVGWDDSTAFVLSCSVPGTEAMYITRTWGRSEMFPFQIAESIRECRDTQLALGFRAPSVCFDMGGLGKSIAKELQNVHGLAIFPAEKYDKAGSIRLFRGGLAKGTIKLLTSQATELRSEWSALPWDDKHHEHHPKFLDHYSDAALYARRGHFPREEEARPDEPVLRHDEHEQLQASKYKAHLEKRAELRGKMRFASSAAERRDLETRIKALDERWRRQAQ